MGIPLHIIKDIEVVLAVEVYGLDPGFHVVLLVELIMASQPTLPKASPQKYGLMIRVREPLFSLSKGLSNPYFWRGLPSGEVGWSAKSWGFPWVFGPASNPVKPVVFCCGNTSIYIYTVYIYIVYMSPKINLDTKNDCPWKMFILSKKYSVMLGIYVIIHGCNPFETRIP